MKLETREQRNRARSKLRDRDGNKCHWCGRIMLFHENERYHPLLATIEHLREKWRGGSDRMGNLVLAHLDCNHKRNARDAKAPVPDGVRRVVIGQEARP